MDQVWFPIHHRPVLHGCLIGFVPPPTMIPWYSGGPSFLPIVDHAIYTTFPCLPQLLLVLLDRYCILRSLPQHRSNLSFVGLSW